jgi:endonuclease YncB( thermonuclease family)
VTRPELREPEEGYCFAAEMVKARDGDTQVYRHKRLGKEIAIRLLDTWIEEMKRGGREARLRAAAARDYVVEFMADKKLVKVHILPPHEGEDILSLLTFDRFVGRVWADGICLNTHLVEKGYASSTKGGALGI